MLLPQAVDNSGHGHHFEFQHSNLRSLLLCVALSFHSVFEVCHWKNKYNCSKKIMLPSNCSRSFIKKKNFHLSNLYFAGARNRSPAKQGRHGHALLSGDDAQVYNLRQKLLLLLQVMMHKAIMAFSLGLNIAQSSLSVRILNMRLRIVWQNIIKELFDKLLSKVKAFVLSCAIFSLASPLGVGIGDFFVLCRVESIKLAQVLDSLVFQLPLPRRYAVALFKYVSP